MTRRIEIAQPFDLATSLTMGQAFRCALWAAAGASGANAGPFVGEYRVGGPEGEIGDADLDDELRRYLRLDTDDIENIYVDIAGRDSRIGPLLERYRGVSILRQEPREFGNSVELTGETRRTFPTPEALTQASESRHGG